MPGVSSKWYFPLSVFRIDRAIIHVHNPNMFMDKTYRMSYAIPKESLGTHELTISYKETQYMKRQHESEEISKLGYQLCLEDYIYDNDCYYQPAEEINEVVNCTTPW